MEQPVGLRRRFRKYLGWALHINFKEKLFLTISYICEAKNYGRRLQLIHFKLTTVNPVSYQIKLAQFEGPFDLLLFFIERDELDIYNIPIHKILQHLIDDILS